MATPTEAPQGLGAPVNHYHHYTFPSGVHSIVVPMYGYSDRVFPCLNDTGTCEYMNSLFIGHIEGMFFTGILWITLIFVFVAWAFLRCVGRPKSRRAGAVASAETKAEPTTVRMRRALGAFWRKRLLPDSIRPIFGRATRLQVLVLALLSAYLILWSFIGIMYGKWVTPVPGHPGLTNTRTSLAPWADRVGVLAYALTPFLILLGSRESILSLMTGLPHQSFNFLHRWVGFVVFAQGILHTVGWVIVEVGMTRPQPQSSRDWISQKYMIGGCAAMGMLTLMVVLSTSWGIRLTGYEFFRKSHYVFAIAYFAACVVHWHKLEVFMAPSLILWVIDRAIRLIRSALIHYQRLPSGKMGFRAAQAAITRFPDEEHGDVIRLDFENRQKAWPIGKHFYLCFSELTIWQSHPFTPLNAPIAQDGVVKHSYIMRVKSGATRKLADLAEMKLTAADTSSTEALAQAVTPVIVTGPYGEAFLRNVTDETNVMCVAGGTGVTAVLGVLLELARQTPVPDRKIEFIWAVRHASNVKWVQEELDELRKVQRELNMTILIYATREATTAPTTPSSAEEIDEKKAHETLALQEVGSSSSRETPPPCGSEAEMDIRRATGATERRPDLGRLVNDFVAGTVRGPTVVIGSGPGSMASDLRTVIAAQNCGAKVWKGEERFSVRLVCDNRLER